MAEVCIKCNQALNPNKTKHNRMGGMHKFCANPELNNKTKKIKRKKRSDKRADNRN